jgi:Transcriptional regulator PadR-like family
VKYERRSRCLHFLSVSRGARNITARNIPRFPAGTEFGVEPRLIWRNGREGSLYRALHRMEHAGWIASEWAMTETNRKVKDYKLTNQGREQLQQPRASINW